MKIAAISVADLFERMEGWPIEEKGLYPLLILKMYARSKPLLDDDAENARMFGYRDVRTYKAAKAKLVARGVIACIGGQVCDERAMAEIAKAKQRREEAVANGKKGGRTSKKAGAADQPNKVQSAGDLPAISPRSQSDPICNEAENQRLRETLNTSPSPEPKEEKKVTPSSVPPAPKPKAPRGARLQPDWALPDDWLSWTRINFAHAGEQQVRVEADRFRDYWIAKAGQQACKLDWQATWRNWCRTAFAGKPSAQPVSVGRMNWEEAKAKRHERQKALLDGIRAGAFAQ